VIIPGASVSTSCGFNVANRVTQLSEASARNPPSLRVNRVSKLPVLRKDRVAGDNCAADCLLRDEAF
jgi:hypothetical protein